MPLFNQNDCLLQIGIARVSGLPVRDGVVLQAVCHGGSVSNLRNDGFLFVHEFFGLLE